MGIPDHLTCLLRNLPSGQEATVRSGHGTTVWFKIGKGVHQGCILSPCLFNLYAEYIIQNAGLDDTQAGIKIAQRNVDNLRYAHDTTLMAESEPGEEKGYPLQYSGLENSMDSTVHGVTKSRTRLSDFRFRLTRLSHSSPLPSEADIITILIVMTLNLRYCCHEPLGHESKFKSWIFWIPSPCNLIGL